MSGIAVRSGTPVMLVAKPTRPEMRERLLKLPIDFNHRSCYLIFPPERSILIGNLMALIDDNPFVAVWWSLQFEIGRLIVIETLNWQGNIDTSSGIIKQHNIGIENNFP